MNIKNLLIVLIVLCASKINSQTICDTLVLTNGNILLVSDVEFRHNIIQFIECGNESDIKYEIKKEKLFEVREANIYALNDTLKNKLLSDNIKLDVFIREELEFSKIKIEKIDKSLIIISKSPGELVTVKIADIRRIRIYDKSRFKRNILWGIGTGGAFGFLIGTQLKGRPLGIPFVSGEFNNGSRNFLTLTGIMAGSIVGIVVGSININYIIAGKEENFRKVERNFQY